MSATSERSACEVIQRINCTKAGIIDSDRGAANDAGVTESAYGGIVAVAKSCVTTVDGATCCIANKTDSDASNAAYEAAWNNVGTTIKTRIKNACGDTADVPRIVDCSNRTRADDSSCCTANTPAVGDASNACNIDTCKSRTTRRNICVVLDSSSGVTADLTTVGYKAYIAGGKKEIIINANRATNSANTTVRD